MVKGLLLCLVVALSALGAGRADGALQKFYIGGLFPNDTEDERVRNSLGVYPEVAATLAVQHVQESGLLASHNISLEMLSFGTSCMEASAVRSYLQLTRAIRAKTEAGKSSVK